MFPLSNGEEYLKAKEMVKATDQEIFKMYQQTQQYSRRRTQLLGQGASSQNLMLEPKKKEADHHSATKPQNSNRNVSSKDVVHSMT